MTAKLPCPDAARLGRLLDESLPEGEQVEISAHLSRCPACRQRLEGLAAGQDSWEAARALAAAPPGVPDSALLPTRVQADPGATLPPEGAADLPPLGPPGREGSLGRIDHYEVLERVGRGGMGVVLRAFDEKLHRVVALKVMAPELAAGAAARQRFVREARAAAAVAHEHVVTTHAVEAEHRPPYLVMQFVAGQSLQAKLDRAGALETREILRIGAQIAAGLAAAHKQGLVHRDVKPANILLENGVERVKITDFGLARAAADVSLTQSGVIAGTPLYMAPEQAQGQHVDHRADLFSLGSVLYAMCTGLPPFRAGNTLAVLRRVVEDAPRPIRESFPEVPAALAALVERLHAKDPSGRPQTAAAVAEELGAMLAELQAAGRVASAPAVQAAAPPPRRRQWWVAALGLLPLLGVVAALLFWPPNPTTSPGGTEPAPSGDLAKMQGAWEPVAVETEGKSQSDDTLLRHRVTVTGPRVANVVNGDPFSDSTVSVDASTTPKHMDWDISVGGGKPFRMLGVYELDGDTLKVNLAPESAGRPKSLTDRHPRGHYYWLVRSRPRGVQPFVLISPSHGSERNYKTLQQAVDDATRGDVIEIRGNGPFISGPVTVSVPLTLRAGAGYRPVLELRPGTTPEVLVKTTAPLVLEGLTLRGIAQEIFQYSILDAYSSLYMSHCTVLVPRSGAAIQSSGMNIRKSVRLSRCKVLSPAVTFAWSHTSEGDCTVDNCIIHGEAGIILYCPASFDPVTIQCRSNTFVVRDLLSLHFFSRPSVLDSDKGLKGLRLNFAQNTVVWQNSLINCHILEDYAPLTVDEIDHLLPRLLEWQDHDTLYPRSTDFLRATHRPDFKPIALSRTFKTRSEWNEYLGTKPNKVTEGRLVFEDGDLLLASQGRMEELPAVNYRLAATSAGKGAGPGGRDLGADVDEVGPGAPYERWRASPDYAQWRKQADALLQGKKP